MADNVRVEILMPRGEWEAAKETARQHDRSLASLIRVLLAKIVAEESAIATPPQESPGFRPYPCR